jgi:nucleotide-binding universal stress UspA family protein
MNASMYSKILVPLDGSTWAERALPHASRIARNHNAELVLLTVYQMPMRDYTDQMALAGVTEISDQLHERAKNYVTSQRNKLRNEGVNASYVLIEGGSPADKICDFVASEDIDLVVMSTHGRSGLARFLFGSVAQKVMQAVRVPVMLIRPEEPEGQEVKNPELES